MEAQADQLSSHPGFEGFDLAYPNIYPTYEMLECVKGLVLQDLHDSATAGYVRGFSVSIRY